MPTARVNDVELYYEERGAGEPLLLVPGFGTGLWIWYRQIPALAEHFRVIAFDPRGVARSDKPEEAVSMRGYADDGAALLEALNVGRAHVLGASFGGFVAQEFALAYPARTRGLILCCTSFGGPRHCPPAPETLQAIASTKGLNTEERVRENLLLAFSPEFVVNNSGEVERVIRLRAENDVPEYAYLRQLQAAMAFDAEGRVAGIEAPTLVITGDADVIVPHENSLNLAAKIPGATLRVVEGGSHTFFIERPEEFNSAVIEFIRSLDT
ncbi:MAG TPA: alpha/beta fold hydrolase [Pyrinomonadaceae bacterium]|jgi:pimeloyl-ACP methyl ester carboxylesterase|nr:alpha/beta fold hydrolase [Pyrinomonadaceae bacterium]